MSTTTAPTMTKAGTALMTIIGKHQTSFFDGGIVTGEGIWHEALTGETAGAPDLPKTAKGVAGVIRRLAETGYLDVSDQGEDGVWVSLTEQGAATATALAEGTPTKPTQTAQKATKAPASAKAASKPADSPATLWADVKFYRLRKVGTARRLPYLAPGTTERKDAEKVAAQIAKGKTVADLAATTGKSPSSVRRLVAAVELAHEVEAGDYADQIKDGKVILPAREEAK